MLYMPTLYVDLLSQPSRACWILCKYALVVQRAQRGHCTASTWQNDSRSNKEMHVHTFGLRYGTPIAKCTVGAWHVCSQPSMFLVAVCCHLSTASHCAIFTVFCQSGCCSLADRANNLPVEVRLLRLDKAEHRRPEYLQLNPLGKVWQTQMCRLRFCINLHMHVRVCVCHCAQRQTHTRTCSGNVGELYDLNMYSRILHTHSHHQIVSGRLWVPAT
jgi:hypothetical protein